MVRSTEAKIPFESRVRERLHAAKLNLRLSNQYVVYSRGMVAMSKSVLIAPFTIKSNEVLMSQDLLQNMAVRVRIGKSSGVFRSYKRRVSWENRVESSKDNQVVCLGDVVKAMLRQSCIACQSLSRF